jgi:hypothetical protein
MEAEPMHVLQFAKRSVVTLAALALVLNGCGGSDAGPTVPFNATGTTADLEAVNTTFASPAFTEFSALSVMFDAALGGAPLVSSSAAALDLRGASTAKALQAAAARSAERIARIMPRRTAQGFSASSAAIPPAFVGKTFVWNGTAYEVSALTGAPSGGVRFILYAIDPVTLLPAAPLTQTGYVDLVDMSSGTTSAARVIVVSGTTTYLDYRVNLTATITSARVTVLGYITDGVTEATFNLRSVLTGAGLTLSHSIDVPERDLSIDLSMTATGTTPEASTIAVTLDMRGQNGWARMTGNFSASGATLNVAINGTPFATITAAAGAEPVISGADGQPLTPEELEALQQLFEFSGGAFLAFDQLLAPVGSFIEF